MIQLEEALGRTLMDAGDRGFLPELKLFTLFTRMLESAAVIVRLIVENQLALSKLRPCNSYD